MDGGVLAVEPPFEPEHLVAALNEAGIGYVVVGGLAAGAHGVVRATRALDLVADSSPENLRLLVEIETGVDAPISSLAHLRAMKRGSERPRDAVDLAELDELHGPG